MLERIIHSIAEKRQKRENAQRRLFETAIITADNLDHIHLNTGWKAQEFYLELNYARSNFGDPFLSNVDCIRIIEKLNKKGLLESHNRLQHLPPEFKLTVKGNEEAEKIWARLYPQDK